MPTLNLALLLAVVCPIFSSPILFQSYKPLEAIQWSTRHQSEKLEEPYVLRAKYGGISQRS
jgi:hypothetical protein